MNENIKNLANEFEKGNKKHNQEEVASLQLKFNKTIRELQQREKVWNQEVEDL
jgi:hypothetical protein